MKKIILGVVAVMLTCTTTFAGTKAPVKKSKQACTSCAKAKCTSKATCPKVTSSCVCK